MLPLPPGPSHRGTRNITGSGPEGGQAGKGIQREGPQGDLPPAGGVAGGAGRRGFGGWDPIATELAAARSYMDWVRKQKPGGGAGEGTRHGPDALRRGRAGGQEAQATGGEVSVGARPSGPLAEIKGNGSGREGRHPGDAGGRRR